MKLIPDIIEYKEFPRACDKLFGEAQEGVVLNLVAKNQKSANL